jgi:hypothetical protein
MRLFENANINESVGDVLAPIVREYVGISFDWDVFETGSHVDLK